MYGGKSSEREVSLESGKYIYQAAKDLGYEAQLVDYPKDFLSDQLTKNDFIFIALHGEDGEARCEHYVCIKHAVVVITSSSPTPPPPPPPLPTSSYDVMSEDDDVTS